MQHNRPSDDIGPAQIDLLFRIAKIRQRRQRRGIEGTHQRRLLQKQREIRRSQSPCFLEKRRHRRQPQKDPKTDE